MVFGRLVNRGCSPLWRQDPTEAGAEGISPAPRGRADRSCCVCPFGAIGWRDCQYPWQPRPVCRVWQKYRSTLEPTILRGQGLSRITAGFYEATEKAFYQYDPASGLWRNVRAEEALDLVADNVQAFLCGLSIRWRRAGAGTQLFHYEKRLEVGPKEKHLKPAFLMLM